MSGPFGSSQWMYNAGGDFYSHEVSGALRFDGSSNINRSASSTGNQKIFTFSAWIKPSALGSDRTIFGAADSSSYQVILSLDPNNRFRIFAETSSSYGSKRSNALARDLSAWYHIVARFDTTQSTAANRIRLYVNGEQITSFSESVDIAQNQNLPIFIGGQTCRIGARRNDDQRFNGYIAEVNFIDGQSLDPSSFGETKSGIWIPKEYSGSYGTNGFYLKFDGNANDSSGNSNNFSTGSIGSHDYMLDSPTNNFATFNPLDNLNTSLFSEGNLKVGNTTGSHKQKTRSTFAVENNFYYEAYRVDGGTRNFNVGVAAATASISSTGNTGVYTKNYSGGSGDILMFAYSADANALWTGLNGTWDNSATVAEIEAGTTTNATHTSILSEPIAAVFIDQASSYSGRIIANFGQDDTFAGAISSTGNTDENGQGAFKYAPPSGFLSLCSASLPSPATDPAKDESPEDYFNTALYTGSGAAGKAVNVGFKPDFIWLKQRNAADNHVLFDVVRGGISNELYINLANAEATSTGALTSYNSDGFTLGNSGDLGRYNESGSTYASWNWKASGTGVSNTDGTITTTVSANEKAGFSIVKYTGNSSGTIGHGLGVTPDFVMIKNRDTGSYNWNAWHNSFTAGQVIYPNLSNARNSDTNVWNNTLPTSTVISVDNDEVNKNNQTHVAYVFANKDGYFKTGTFTGNGSSNGPFVHTGFRVAWYMLKRLDTSSEWNIVDNHRNEGEQPLARELRMNLSNSESYSVTYRAVDFLSNGFKMRTSDADHNASGGTYLYLAFAEQPFKYANAR